MRNKSDIAPLSFREKVGYGVGDMASNFYLGFFNIFLLYYYVEVWDISPVSVATMFLVTKVIDAISDPLIGLLVDRTKTEFGRFRSYLYWMAPAYALLGYLLFIGPDLSGTGKLVFVYVSYSLVMLAYTAINVPYSALLAVISPLSEERTKATQYRFVFAALGALLVGACAKPLVNFLGEGDELLGFRLTITFFAGLSLFLFYITFVSTKERILPERHTSSVWEDIGVLRKNISWIILAICSSLIVIGFITRFSSTVFYVKYNMLHGDENVLWWMDHTSLMITSGSVGQLFGALITPFLLKFFDKRNLVVGLNLLFAGSIFATYFVSPTQYALTLILFTFGIFTFGATVTLLFSMYTDCTEYGEWVSGNNSAGLTVGASMFALKFGAAIGSAIPGYVLAWYGFVKDQPQTEMAQAGIGTMWNVVPAIFLLLAAFLMMFYKLDSKAIKTMEQELLDRRGRNIAV